MVKCDMEWQFVLNCEEEFIFISFVSHPKMKRENRESNEDHKTLKKKKREETRHLPKEMNGGYVSKQNAENRAETKEKQSQMDRKSAKWTIMRDGGCETWL